MLRRAAAAIAITSVPLALGCLPGAGPPLLDAPDATAPPPVSLAGDGGTAAGDVDLGDPFAVVGLVPSHGPFSGGTRAVIDGRGFPSSLRVWIGGTELAPSAVFASDPTRAAVETPAGAPGAADVRVRDDATGRERVLPAGFFYDAFVVQPNQGATTGGTRIALTGSGTAFDATTTVTVDGKPCTGVAVASPTSLQCTTPAGSPGTKDVTVTTAAGAPLQARDAFTYADSPDGYRGGLAGGALHGSLRVLAFDAWTGTPIASAYAIAGALTARTDGAGVAELHDPSLTGAVTVTVAAKCHQPMTFVAVPVDTVTAYLTPTLDLSCAHGDPPSVGGHGGVSAGEILGQIVFPGIEFKPGAWTVPSPLGPNERQAAYVFAERGSPTDTFYLPDPSTASTPASAGSHGYPYTLPVAPGNTTLYALAGIENRTVTPPTFVPYAMGVARGVLVQPGGSVPDVDIPMTTLLDHVVTLAPHPPAPGARGPDRLVSHVAVTLDQLGFAVFPNGVQASLLPVSGGVPFVGLPALDGTLSGMQYVIAASAATGSSESPPASVVGQIRTTDTSGAVAVGGFLQPPVMVDPGTSTWAGTHASVTVSGAVDLLELSITSGGGLVSWTIVAPGNVPAFDLPDLRPLSGAVGLVSGPITATAWVARIDGFSYATLRTGQMGPGGWSAYAYDTIRGAY